MANTYCPPELLSTFANDDHSAAILAQAVDSIFCNS
jgi:hypothetical protein